MLANDSSSDYRSIPPYVESEDCEVVVEYYYIVTNTIPKPHTVDKVVQIFDENDNDLT